MQIQDFIIVFFLLTTFSCKKQERGNWEIPKSSEEDSAQMMHKKRFPMTEEDSIEFLYYHDLDFPEWFVNSDLLNGYSFMKDYFWEIEIEPTFLEEDFNKDGEEDIAIIVKEIESSKKGIAIIHGKTKKIHILAAGKDLKNYNSDEIDWINKWEIKGDNLNLPDAEEEIIKGENKTMTIKNPSIYIQKEEESGGLIYWDGEQYAYFQQSK